MPVLPRVNDHDAATDRHLVASDRQLVASDRQLVASRGSRQNLLGWSIDHRVRRLGQRLLPARRRSEACGVPRPPVGDPEQVLSPWRQRRPQRPREATPRSGRFIRPDGALGPEGSEDHSTTRCINALALHGALFWVPSWSSPTTPTSYRPRTTSMPARTSSSFVTDSLPTRSVSVALSTVTI